MSKSPSDQNLSGKKSDLDQKKVKTEFLISKNIESDSITFQLSTKEDSVIKTDNKILSDFLNKLENLVTRDREEIPSFTRIYHKEKLISETFNEVEKNQTHLFIARFFVFETQKKIKNSLSCGLYAYYIFGTMFDVCRYYSSFQNSKSGLSFTSKTRRRDFFFEYRNDLFPKFFSGTILYSN